MVAVEGQWLHFALVDLGHVFFTNQGTTRQSQTMLVSKDLHVLFGIGKMPDSGLCKVLLQNVKGFFPFDTQFTLLADLIVPPTVQLLLFLYQQRRFLFDLDSKCFSFSLLRLLLSLLFGLLILLSFQFFLLL